VEILLVVTIMAVSLGVAIPNLARSYKGARLRRSGRTIQMMHRQAKSKAVLGQTYAALFFDDVKRTVELVTVGGGGMGRDAFFGDAGGGAGGGAPGEIAGGAAVGGDEAAADVRTERTAALEEGVELAGFRGGAEVDGVHYVQYYPNGMCQEWSLDLRDEGGRSLSVSVDPVTGKVETEQHD